MSAPDPNRDFWFSLAVCVGLVELGIIAMNLELIADILKQIASQP